MWDKWGLLSARVLSALGARRRFAPVSLNVIYAHIIHGVSQDIPAKAFQYVLWVGIKNIVLAFVQLVASHKYTPVSLATRISLRGCSSRAQDTAAVSWLPGIQWTRHAIRLHERRSNRVLTQHPECGTRMHTTLSTSLGGAQNDALGGCNEPPAEKRVLFRSRGKYDRRDGEIPRLPSNEKYRTATRKLCSRRWRWRYRACPKCAVLRYLIARSRKHK